ncbi:MULTISPECIES: polysaccharide deacetylase family protein [unclassified Nocardiopsis]|uniref:polysaccharide deacetylase family protein n=1 Tax=unclassified Nocardiopsis TaxID=2649073 RepID=UPI0013570EF7|nr:MULTISPECIES: polysaccharide deacetylase family protein [unclassified Nocardiopsis]
MSSTPVNEAVRRPGGRGPWWSAALVAAVAALVPPLAACGSGVALPRAADPELITVVLSEPDEGVGEWRGSADDFPDHPHVPEGVAIDVSYPRFEGAGAFAEELAARVDREVRDFRGASRQPVGLDIDWEVAAAGNGVLGVRLVRTEEDYHGLRQAYETSWYDTASGRTAHAAELLADDAALSTLNRLVRDLLADRKDVDTEGLHPVLRTYDSLGFNAGGDLVVEFDDGHLSPVVEGHVPTTEPGRVVAVVPADRAVPLLSDLGARAREASLSEDPVLAVEEPVGGPASPAEPPGVVEAGDPGLDCSRAKCIALTFDDGPAPTTPHLLDLLAEEGVKASFFLNGDPALTRPGVLRRAYAEGHELASHNDQHEHMTKAFSGEELAGQVAAVSAMVRRQTGHTVTLFRPPYGDSSPRVLAEIGRQGMAEILWSLDSGDWGGADRDEIAENVLEQAEPGAVVLLHDTLAPTLAAVPEIIERLRGRGYEFATVSQVYDGPEPGSSHPPEGLTAPAGP